MRRALVHAKDYTLNVEATEIKILEGENSIVVLNSDEIVGVFNVDSIKSAHMIPERRETP
jgi:hypothetical protein